MNLSESFKQEINELWHLYIENKEKDPVLAKTYLEKYKNLCQKENIPFDYYELIRINNRIAKIGLSDKKLSRKTYLEKQISEILKKKGMLSSIELANLEKLITELRENYKDRGFYPTFYEGCYELKKQNPKKAIDLFNSILEKEPENFIVLKNLISAYYASGAFYKCASTINEYKKYRELDLSMCILLVKCYLKNKEFDKISILSESLLDKNNIDLLVYFSRVVELLENSIEIHKKDLYEQTSMRYIKGILTNIENADDQLNKHKEMLGQVLSTNPETNNSILEQRIAQIYDNEIRECLFNENDQNIHLSNINSYINNLEISQEERMLLYLSAARVLFINRLPKKAQKYMDLVARTPDKSETVKQQYDICQKNKKLYLNK